MVTDSLGSLKIQIQQSRKRLLDWRHRKMIIVKFCSGLGNQLYQYAIYEKMKKVYPKQEVLADLSSFEDVDILNQGNGFYYGFAITQFFDTKVDLATREQINAINYEFYFSKLWRSILPKALMKNLAGPSIYAKIRARILSKYRVKKSKYIGELSPYQYNGNLFFLDEKKDYYLGGLWQNLHYFDDISYIIREKLKYKAQLSNLAFRFSKDIRNCESVCLHVRRGDFTSNKYNSTHNICGIEYYLKAISHINEKINCPVFFVFSDNIEYCKHQFASIENIVFVSEEASLSTQDEMQLMSECRHAIISNSTFSFWATWIRDSPDKIVICPKYASKGISCWNELSHPPHWVEIDNLER